MSVDKTKQGKTILESESLFSSLIRNSSDVISILKPDGTICYQSPSIERALGYMPGELTGANAFQMVHPDDVQAVMDAFTQVVLTQDSSLSATYRFRHKDGTWHMLESIGSNQLQNPAISGIVVNSRDVTERVRIKEALKESEEKYRLLFERESDAIALCDTETLKMMDVNDAFVKLYGYSKDEIAGMKATDLSAEPEMTVASLRKIAQEGNDHVPIRWHRKKDGTVFPIEISAGSFVWKGREVMCAIFKDITERKRAEEELKLFSQAIEIAMDGVQITDLNGHIMYSNNAVKEIYGFSAGELFGRHVNELNADKEFASKVILPSIIETGRWNGELMVVHRTGREFPIWLSASIVKDGRGSPIAMLGVIRDITSHKMAEKERENLILELQTALANIKTLKGLLPICAWCKNIRDDGGYWKRVETYIQEHSEVSFTAGICPDCLKKVDPETYGLLANKGEQRHSG